jgi:uncharacterized protein involved in exopolysaccharide biosynthesis
MAISYDEIDDTKKKVVTDLLSKREAIDAVLADIQTERAVAELPRVQKEQELNAEKNRLTEELRKLRKATLV